jgi:hypothetical protein
VTGKEISLAARFLFLVALDWASVSIARLKQRVHAAWPDSYLVTLKSDDAGADRGGTKRLQPMPIARSAEIVQTVISVPVITRNKE